MTMTMIANLIIPRFIIEIYGSEVNGLTSTIANVLMVVNLIQAGLSSSVAFLLYEPIEQRNNARIASIILSAKRIYSHISFGIAGIGFIASIILAFVVQGEISREFIFIATLVTCIDSAISTYFTAAGNVFLGAKQDGYITSKITIFGNILSYVLKAFVIIFRLHFMSLYVVNLLICLYNIIAYTLCFKKRYKEYAPREEEKSQIQRVPIPGVKYAAANEASHTAVTGLLTVLVSAASGLGAASVLSVYVMVANIVGSLSNALYSAFVPSYGSVIAEGNMKKVNDIFEIYQFLIITINTLFFMCMAYLMIPFVRLYTEGITDVDYISEPLMVLLVIYALFQVCRVPYNNTVYVKGFFRQTYLQPVVCAGIALVLTFVCSMIHFCLAPIGLIVFYAVNTFYQHYKLPKLFDGFNNTHFWRHFAVATIGVSMALLAYFLMPVYPSSFFIWAIYGVIAALVSLGVIVLLVCIIDMKSGKLTLQYFVSRIKRQKRA